MSYSKYCAGYQPSTVIVCGPDPLSGIAPPCVKFPTNIKSPTWNSIKTKKIRKTRVVPNPNVPSCKTYQPAIQTLRFCPIERDPLNIEPLALISKRSGCDCGAATVTRVRVSSSIPANITSVIIRSLQSQLEFIVPLDGSCIELTVDDQLTLNQEGIEIEVTTTAGTYYYRNFCFTLSAVAYAFEFEVDVSCPDQILS